MFNWRRYIVLLIFLVSGRMVFAQESDFCEAITAILRDAPNKFINVRGKIMSSNATASMYHTNIEVPGTINSRFVASMGLFYEGALVQSSEKLAIVKQYGEYKAQLEACLAPAGYRMSATRSFASNVEDLGKVIFMKKLDEGADIRSLPGHVTLEVDYNKNNGLYTLSFYIFEH